MTQGLFYLSEVYFKTGLLAQTIYLLNGRKTEKC